MENRAKFGIIHIYRRSVAWEEAGLGIAEEVNSRRVVGRGEPTTPPPPLPNARYHRSQQYDRDESSCNPFASPHISHQPTKHPNPSRMTPFLHSNSCCAAAISAPPPPASSPSFPMPCVSSAKSPPSSMTSSPPFMRPASPSPTSSRRNYGIRLAATIS